MTGFRTSVCSPWIHAGDVLAQVEAVTSTTLSAAEAADIAISISEILYKFSGGQFSGNCGPETVRPFARPTDQDSRGLAHLNGWLGSWGMCSSYGMAASGVASHYGCSKPPEIELGVYPVTSIVSVKIDGVVIPASEYYIQDFKQLIRMRPIPPLTPTERYGWPTCNRLDLPDTEPGTMSISFMYGTPPPASGVRAAKALAKQMALQQLNLPNELPSRTTSIARQGVTATVLDIIDYVAAGRTGIYAVDSFIRAYNPSGTTRPALVWSPDTGRSRRMP